MSTPTAVTIIMIVFILTVLAAYIAWLGRQSNSCTHRHYVGNCLQCLPDLCRSVTAHWYLRERSLVDHDHGCADRNHSHDGVYASTVHDHDERYALTGHGHEELAPRGHRHDDDYSPLGHIHREYVTRDEMNRLIEQQVERRMEQLKVSRSVSVDTGSRILYGILFGGVIGALAGWTLNLTLPRSVFELRANTTYNVDGRQIEQVLTAYSVWPKFGIVLGCIVIGAILGGITLWIIDMIRARRQNRQTIEEAR